MFHAGLLAKPIDTAILHLFRNRLQIRQAFYRRFSPGYGQLSPDRTITGQLLKTGIKRLDHQRAVVSHIIKCLEKLPERYQPGARNSTIILVDMNIAQIFFCFISTARITADTRYTSLTILPILPAGRFCCFPYALQRHVIPAEK